MRKIILITIGFSVALMAELTRDAAIGIVSDSVTNLMWQDNEIGTMTTWQGAIQRCEALELGGYGDWRLPNINELKSIVYRGKVVPTIKNGFVKTTSNYKGYWSSTTHTFSGGVAAFYIGFDDSVMTYNSKTQRIYVRCVRAGQ